MSYKHIPVMLDEVLEYLDPRSGQKIIDCTLGGGGYTFAIAKKVGEKGRVVAFDADKMAIRNAKEKIKTHPILSQEGNKNINKNIILKHENFKNLQTAINEISKSKKELAANNYDGIVFDLGLSSAQLEDRNRGFSFQLDAPLDMSFGQTTDNRQRTTKYIVNNYNQDELEKILREYGEERFSHRIAKKIVEARKEREIGTTGQLVSIIQEAVPKRFQKGKTHVATKTFQALRIETNRELESLKSVLPQTLKVLKSGAKIVIVSFHSLEDRIVKHFFKDMARGCICPKEAPICVCKNKPKIKIITKKPVLPSAEEIKENPRARSAKLRVGQKI